MHNNATYFIAFDPGTCQPVWLAHKQRGCILHSKVQVTTCTAQVYTSWCHMTQLKGENMIDHWLTKIDVFECWILDPGAPNSYPRMMKKTSLPSECRHIWKPGCQSRQCWRRSWYMTPSNEAANEAQPVLLNAFRQNSSQMTKMLQYYTTRTTQDFEISKRFIKFAIN